MKPRPIRGEKADRLWRRLHQVWGVDPSDYWYPLTQVDRADVLAFQAPYFQDALGGGLLEQILREHGVERVLEFREGGAVYELPVESIDPGYTGDEGYWCSRELDWILYASHESSISAGGRWLISAVKRAWPGWQEHIWITPFFR